MGKLITPEVWGKKKARPWSPDEGGQATTGPVTNFAPLWRLPTDMRRSALSVGKTDQDRYRLYSENLVVNVFFPDTTDNKIFLPVLVAAVSTGTENMETAIDTLQLCQLEVEYIGETKYTRRFWFPSATIESMHVETSVRSSNNLHICRLWLQMYSANDHTYRNFPFSVKEIVGMSFVRADGRECVADLIEYSLLSPDGVPVSVSCAVAVDEVVIALSGDK